MTTRKRGITRRTFLRGAAAAAPFFVSRYGLAAVRENRKGRIVRDRKLNVACVGCGGKGWGDTAAMGGENVIALCDVDYNRARGTFNRYPKAKRYRDYRHMLLEMGKEIDAVTVSTPDHMHYPVARMAVSMGKHVFVQKPLTHTVAEARDLAQAAREHEVATQMGIQGHAKEGIRLLKEWLDADAVGKVHEIQYWTNRPIWPQGIERPGEVHDVPGTLDWNRWLGVAPERPFNSCYHPFRWRGWWDFGCGALGDIGCHAMDAAFWALDLGSPTSVEAVTSGVNDETAPKWSIVTYQFPARGKRPAVKVVWHDGNKKPERPRDLEPERKLPGGIGGQLIFGDKGTMMANDVYVSSIRIIPEAKMKAFQRPEKTLPRSPGHVKEWLDACKGGKPPGANFDYAGPLTEMVLLGNLAVRTGKKIEWDSKNLRCTNVPEANPYVRKPYRVF